MTDKGKIPDQDKERLHVTPVRAGWRNLLHWNYWHVPLILSAFLIVLSQYQYTTFHLFAELFAVSIAFTLFSLAWHISSYSTKNVLVYLAAGYFWVGCFDLLHLLSFKGMGEALLPRQGTETAIEFWLSARFLEAAVLLSSMFLGKSQFNRTWVFMAFGFVWLVTTVAVFASVFPPTHVEQIGLTPFKIVSEYVIIGVLLTALYFLYKKGRATFGADKCAITASVAFTVVAELCFTLYVDVFGFFNLLGHILKIFSFWFIYQSIILSNIRRPYLEVMRMKGAIEEVPSMVLVGDPRGKIIYANPTFEKVTGFSHQNINDESSPAYQLIPEEGHHRYQASDVWNIVEMGGVWHGRTLNFKKDNTPFWEYSSIKGILNEKNEIDGIVATKDDITNRTLVNEYLTDHESALSQTLLGAVGTVEKLLQARDPYTSHHSEKVAELSVYLGQKFGLPPTQTEGLRLASIIHDIGKIKIPMEILNKPGRLSDDEMSIIKMHPTVGYEAIKSIPFPWDVPNIVLCHHERLDGSGYPNGLKGDEIPIESQIMAVADVIEAVSSHRPYRASLGTEKAAEILKEGRGTAYNANIVDLALEGIESGEVERILQS